MLQQPGDEVGNKVAVPKGWFNWPDGGPRDPETLVMLTVTAWDPEGSKWDSRDEKKKSKKERNVKRFIVHPTVVSDDDDPRGYPMRMSAYIAFRDAMQKRAAIRAEVSKEVQRLAGLKKSKKQAAADDDDDPFDSAMEEAVASDGEPEQKTPSPKEKAKQPAKPSKKKKQRVHDLQEGDGEGMLTPVVGVGLVRSAVWEYVSIVSNGKVLAGKSAGKMWYKMQCNMCKQVIRTIGKSTTPMLRHFKSRHTEFHQKVFLVKKLKGLSPEERRLAEIKPMSFAMAFSHHVKYMYMVSHDQRALGVGQTTAFRNYLIGYNKQARPPCNKTLGRLLLATNICMKRKIAAALGKTADELLAVGLKALCLQSDLWFGKDKRSYFGINVTWIEKRTTKTKRGKTTVSFEMMTAFIALHSFPSYTHTGKAISEAMLKVLAEYGTKAADVSLSTIDGASNGIKAMSIANIPMFVGTAHNLARGLMYATGEAGSESLNPDMRRLMEHVFALAAKQRSSAKLSMMYAEAQENMCASAKKTKLPGLARTRWTGRPVLAAAVNRNEGPTKLVYHSFGPGDDADELEHDGFDSSYDVASDDDSEIALAMSYKTDASIIPTAEEYKDLRHFEGVMAPAVMVTKQFETGPDKATAQQVVPLLCYLGYVYDPKTAHLFRCPLRSKKYQDSGNRTWENVPHKELTKPNKVLVAVLCKQLKTRFAAIPDIFLLAAALNPFADLTKSFRGNKNLIARAKAIYEACLRTVLKNIVRVEFEDLDKAAAKAKATQKISNLVAKKASTSVLFIVLDV